MTATGRIYRRAQMAFVDWCEERRIGEVDHTIVARYLEDCRIARGASAVPVHLSAAGCLLRARDQPLDTRHYAIQAVMEKARQSLRAARARAQDHLTETLRA